MEKMNHFCLLSVLKFPIVMLTERTWPAGTGVLYWQLPPNARVKDENNTGFSPKLSSYYLPTGNPVNGIQQ
jgi:hypothetical protein